MDSNSPLDRLDWLVWVSSHRNITASALRVATLIAHCINSKSGKSWPSYDMMAEQLNMSRTMVYQGVKRLNDLGVIELEERVGRSNYYRLTQIPESGIKGILQSRNAGQPIPESRTGTRSGKRNPYRGNNKGIEQAHDDTDVSRQPEPNPEVIQELRQRGIDDIGLQQIYQYNPRLLTSMTTVDEAVKQGQPF